MSTDITLGLPNPSGPFGCGTNVADLRQRARSEDGLPGRAEVIRAQLAVDAAVPPVIDKEWRLYVCWSRSGRMGPLPKMSDDDELPARTNAVIASHCKGVRYVALFNGPSAWPAAVYMNGAELDDEAAEAAYLAE